MKYLNSRGQAAVEFAFIIPVIFIFVYAVLEFSFLFIQQQRVSLLSRETTNAAFRDCSSESDPTKLSACLNTTVTEVNTQAANLLVNFGTRGTVIASVYGPDAASKTKPPSVKLLSRKQAGGGGNLSHYAAGDLDAQFVQDQGVVVIGETFYPYAPLTPIKKLLQLLKLPVELYENVIY